MNEKLVKLVELIKDEKQFKLEHKEIFKELSEKRKAIKEAKNEVLSLMTDADNELNEGDYTFTKTKKRGLQHSMEILDEVLQQDGGVGDYVDRVAYDREYLTHKKIKRS